MTPAELIALAENRSTELARKLALGPFEGKWLRLTGRVRDVSQMFGGGVSVEILLADESTVYLRMKEDLYTEEDLAGVKKGDTFAAEGRFESVSHGLFYLGDCVRVAE